MSYTRQQSMFKSYEERHLYYVMRKYKEEFHLQDSIFQRCKTLETAEKVCKRLNRDTYYSDSSFYVKEA